MLQFSDALSSITVNEREYKRLLGLPRDYVLEGRMSTLAKRACDWYSRHGHPWFHAQQATTIRIIPGGVELDGISMRSPKLHQIFKTSEAHGAIYVALGAGPESEREATRLWNEEKPDEYFFLECYGSAVVEHLTTLVGARLCEWGEKNGVAILPHISPGYQGWDIRDQNNLFGLLDGKNDAAFPGGLEVMESGMLRPRKSLLAVFGLTRRIDLTRNLADLVPCTRCSFQPCAFRRAPYQLGELDFDISPEKRDTTSPDQETLSPLRDNPEYGFSIKALKRWRQDRLVLQTESDGTIRARFHLDGSTCSNMGQPLAVDYHVHVASVADSYRILDIACEVDRKVTGYRAMCSYIEDHAGLMNSIADEKPLLNEPIDAVLDWDASSASSGCLCGVADRNHKWRIVLHTLHFALKKLEGS